MRQSQLLRVIDRWIGPFVLAAIALFRRRRTVPVEIRRVALFKSASIGDTVLLSALVEDLRRRYPDVHLTLFVGNSNRETARCIDGIDEVVHVDVGKPWAAIATIRRKPFDVWLDCGQWPRIDAILSVLARAGCVIGFDTPGESRGRAYDVPVRHDNAIHELENLRGLLRPLGIVGSALPALTRPGLPETALTGVVVFHMYAGSFLGPYKSWPSEHWRRLAEWMHERGLALVFTGGPENSPAIESLAATLGFPVVCYAGQSLAATNAVVGSARLVVSVDSGVMHIAAAMGTPLVGLFGASDPVRWGPVGRPDRTRVVVASPCEGRFFIKKGNEPPRDVAPMTHLGYDTVEAACQELLAHPFAADGGSGRGEERLA